MPLIFFFSLLLCRRSPVQCCIPMMDIFVTTYLKGKACSLPLLNIMRIMDFHWCPLSEWERPYFVEYFYYEKASDFIKCFSVSIEMIMWVLPFIVLIWCITMINFHILSQTFIFVMNPIWLWYSFQVLLDLVHKYYLRIFLNLYS